MPERWDIFCRVVDNFGDAGVCWRLARQLALEHRFGVRLWIDHLPTLARLHPDVVDTPRQTIDEVEVLRWDDAVDLRSGVHPLPQVVVEAFGCGLPEAYVEAMARASRPPLWIVLEYLSAEPWVATHHGLPSPHPRLPLERYYFFPGFVEGTGGLLRESDLFARRDAFGPEQRAAFWRAAGHEPPEPGALTVAVFAYETAPLAGLLQAWETGTVDTVAAIPEGKLLAAALDHFGAAEIPANRVLHRGALEVRVVPFVPQARFDELLWSCDVAFVRGEDSFVRAQWAQRPFIWHIYPQEERAHWRKLDAFLELYGEGLAAPAATALQHLWHAWNQVEGARVSAGSAWAAYASHRATLREHAIRWAARLAGIGGLADNLARFCRDKLK
jgi:uncharacterized repeat protein (TIGR03837 family)